MKKYSVLFSIVSFLLFSCGYNPNSPKALEGKEWISQDGKLLIFSGDSCFSSLVGHFTKVSNDTIFSRIKKDSINNKLLKFKILDDSLFLSVKDADWIHTFSYYKLNTLTTIPSAFEKLSFYIQGCSGSKQECMESYIDIDNIGNFNYGKTLREWRSFPVEDTVNLKKIVPIKDSANSEGLIPSRFMVILNKFLGKCQWEKYNQDTSHWTDGGVNAFSINFPDGNRFTDFNDGGQLPDKLQIVYNYLRSVSRLADLGYFEKKASTKPHCFDAALASRYSQEDSIKYMHQIDSVSYQLPVYPGGENIMEAIIYKNIHRELVLDTNTTYYFYVQYIIKEDGSLQITDTGVNEYGNALGKIKQALFSKDIMEAFSKLARFSPGIYNGKIIPVHLYMIVEYHSII